MRFKEVDVHMTVDVPVTLRLTCKWDRDEELVQEIMAINAEELQIGGHELLYDRMSEAERMHLDGLVEVELERQRGIRRKESYR